MSHRSRRTGINSKVLLAAAAVPASMLVALLSVPASAAAVGCSNEELRTGPSAALPDCRAYEMVSPSGFEPFAFTGNEGDRSGYTASLTGDRVAFYSKSGAPSGSASYGPYFLSSRGSSGWITQDVIPPQTTAGGDFCYPSIVYSLDLSKGVLMDGWNWGEGYPTYPDDNGSKNCSHDEPPLVEGEPRGAQNLFLRDNETGSYQLVNVTPPGVPARDAWFQAGSVDFSHLVFTDPIALTSEAPTPPELAAGFYDVGEDLYEWAGGILRLVTVLPEGKAVWGLLANGNESDTNAVSAVWTHAVSADGERVVFYAGGEVVPKTSYIGGNLYLRENTAKPPVEECAGPSKACTVQLDAAQGGPEGGGGHFQWATPDGSKVFFTDERKLTEDSKAQAGKPDLYEYDLGRSLGGRVVDLTADTAEPASVQGLSGISDDGSYVYFVAEGVLSGEQANSHGDEAQAGKPNLYLRHAGATTFIATLDAFGEDTQEHSREGDTCDWDSFSNFGESNLRGEKHENCMSARVSPDGRFLAFSSLRRLTGYDNVVVATGLRDHEIFLYDAADKTLSCASCDPGSAPPTANPTGLEDPRVLPPMHDPQWYRTPSYLTRNLTNGGRVFFDTQNRLLAADENGQRDVYEYQGGQLSLISSGTSSDASFFRDASASGSDVFFTSTQALVERDSDNTLTLYDARVGGGFVEPPTPPPACEGEEACRGQVSVPPDTLPSGSASFQGPGNLMVPAVNPPPPNTKKPSCKKGFRKTKVHGRTVCKRVRKHHKRKTPTHGARRGVHR